MAFLNRLSHVFGFASSFRPSMLTDQIRVTDFAWSRLDVIQKSKRRGEPLIFEKNKYSTYIIVRKAAKLTKNICIACHTTDLVCS